MDLNIAAEGPKAGAIQVRRKDSLRVRCWKEFPYGSPYGGAIDASALYKILILLVGGTGIEPVTPAV